MSLNFRNHIIPKVLSELIALGFVLFIIPAIYIFELCVVLPAVYTGKGEHDSFWLNFHRICGTFIMFNLVGNLIGVILVDTSTKNVIINSSQVIRKYDMHFHFKPYFKSSLVEPKKIHF